MDAGSLPRTNPPVVLLYNLGVDCFKSYHRALHVLFAVCSLCDFMLTFYERINYDDDNDEIIGQSHVALNPKCIMTKQRRHISILH